MILPGKEAQYYSLYEIGERGTSWLGPLVFAAVGQATGSFRYSILALLVFFVVGFVLVALIPVRRAIAPWAIRSRRCCSRGRSKTVEAPKDTEDTGLSVSVSLVSCERGTPYG